MADSNDQLGTVDHAGGYVVARLQRLLEHDPATVWAMLTEPAKLPDWLASGEVELRPGGAAHLDFQDSGTVIDSTVSAIDAPRLLEYSWSGPGEPERPVRWELAPEGDGTRLTLTLRIPEGEDAARAFAGWEAHLMMLMAALEGVPIRFPFERFKEARERYGSMLPA